MWFRQFVLLTEAYTATFFHGTPLANLPSILRRGILPSTAKETARHWDNPGIVNWGTTAIYFTHDVSTAARYAIGQFRNTTPAVVEFHLTSPRRFKKVEYDPMDRPEVAWDNMEPYSMEGEEIRDLENNIGSVMKAIGARTYWKYDLPKQITDAAWEQGLAVLDGFDLYRWCSQ